MDFGRAFSSGALVAAITAGLGFMTGRPNFVVAAMDGGIMAASVAAADVVHLSDMTPGFVSPSLVAGGVYAGAQAVVRGDNNYLMNTVIGAAADYAADSVM
jgi:hypothetical protein